MQPSSLPRIYCDFNRLVETDTYGLNTAGSRADFAKAGIDPMAGVRIIVYDSDESDDGEPRWLVADAIVVALPSSVLGAHVDPESWRHEPRTASTLDTDAP